MSGLNLGVIRGYLAITGMQEARSGLASTQESLDLTGAAAKRTGVAVGATEKALAASGKTATVAASGSAKLRAAQLSQLAAQERLTTLVDTGNASLARLASAEAAVIRANERVKASTPAASIKATASAATAAESRMAAMNERFVGFLETAGKLGLALGGFEIAREAVEFVKAGKDLTDSLNQVQAASRATDAQMVAVRATAIRLGKDLTVPRATAVDAADAILDLVKAGIQLPRALQAVRPALLLSAATGATMADTAKVLGDTMDLFSLKGSQAAHTADILAASTFGASHDLMGLFDELKQAAPTAQALNIGLDDTVAALTLLAKHGISLSQGGAGLKTMLTNLTKDVPKARQALADLGVTAFDTQGRFVGFPSLFGQLHTAEQRFGKDSQKFVGDLNAAFGVRSQSVAALFAKEGTAAYDEVLARLKSGDLQKYANLMNRGVGAGMAQMRKEFTAAGIAVYQDLEPGLASAVDWLGTKLPGAAHEASGILGPFVHFVGGAGAEAWHLFADGAKLAGDILGPVVHIIDDIKAPLGGIGTVALAAYAGFRVLSAVPGLLETVALKVMYAKDAVVAFGVSSKSAATQFLGSSATISATADATASDVAAAGTVAKVGWAGMLGPIGAVALGIGALVTMFHHSSSASKEAAAAAKAYTDALSEGGDRTTILDSITKQLTDNNVPQLVQMLNKSLGETRFSGNEFVTAIEKGPPALDALRTKLEQYIATQKKQANLNKQTPDAYTQTLSNIQGAQRLITDLVTQHDALTKAAQRDLTDTKAFAGVSSSIDKVSASSVVGSDTAKAYAQMLGIVVDKNGIAAVSSKTLDNAIKTVSSAYAEGTQTGQEFLSELQTFSTSAGTAADRAALIGATLKAANGDALNFVAQMNAASAADHQFASDVKSAASKAKQSTGEYLAGIVNLKKGTIDYHKAAATPFIADLQAMQAGGMAAAEAEFQHARATMSGKAAADAAYKVYVSQTRGKLIDEFTRLTGNAAAAKKLADNYLGVPKKVKTLIEQEGADPVVTVLNKIGQLLANFTGQPWNITVGANVDGAISKLNTLHQVILSDSSFTVSGSGAQGRATGGGAPEGLFWVGEGGPGARPELVEKHGSNVHIYSNGQSRAIAASMGMRVPGFAGGTETFNPRSFFKSLGGTTSSENSAFMTLLSIGNREGFSKKLSTFLKDENHDLDVQIRLRNGLINRLKTDDANLVAAQKQLAQEASTVRDAVRGAFDITTAGMGPNGDKAPTFGSVFAQGKQELGTIKQFVAGIKRLSHEGLNATEVRALAEDGPAAWPEVKALLEASPKQIAAENSMQAQINAQASNLGQFIGEKFYGAQVTKDQAVVNSDRAQLKHENELVDRFGKRIAQQMEHAIKHLDNPQINVYIDGKKVATAVKTGTAKNARRS